MSNTTLNPYALAPLELAVFWFMRAYQAEHNQGVTLQECADYIGREEKAVRRVWAALEKRGLIVIQARLTEHGQGMKNTG